MSDGGGGAEKGQSKPQMASSLVKRPAPVRPHASILRPRPPGPLGANTKQPDPNPTFILLVKPEIPNTGEAGSPSPTPKIPAQPPILTGPGMSTTKVPKICVSSSILQSLPEKKCWQCSSWKDPQPLISSVQIFNEPPTYLKISKLLNLFFPSVPPTVYLCLNCASKLQSLYHGMKAQITKLVEPGTPLQAHVKFIPTKSTTSVKQVRKNSGTSLDQKSNLVNKSLDHFEIGQLEPEAEPEPVDVKPFQFVLVQHAISLGEGRRKQTLELRNEYLDLPKRKQTIESRNEISELPVPNPATESPNRYLDSRITNNQSQPNIDPQVLCFTGKCNRPNCNRTFDQVPRKHVVLHSRYVHNEQTYFGPSTFKLWCSKCKEALPIGVGTDPKVEAHLRAHGVPKPTVYTACGLVLKTCLMWYEKKPRLTQPANHQIPDAKVIAIPNSKKKTIFCPECTASFTSQDYTKLLRQHMEMFHGKEPLYPCPTCGKPERDKSRLDYHIKSHLGIEERLEKDKLDPVPLVPKVVCPTCGKIISSSYLSQHMKKHIEDYQCKVCEFKSENQESLREHVKETHDPSTYYEYNCERCNEGFSMPIDLKTHKLICCDPSERPYPCDLCPRRFKFKPNLQVHLTSMHKCTPAEAHKKIYPGLAVPSWVTDFKYIRNHKKSDCKTLKGKIRKLRENKAKQGSSSGLKEI